MAESDTSVTDRPVPDAKNPNKLYEIWFGGLFPKRRCVKVKNLLKHSRKSIRGPSVRCVCISDIHTPTRIRKERLTWEFPDGDLLLVAGDLTLYGAASEMQKTTEWLAGLPYQHKVVVAGNHDFCLDPNDESYSELAEQRLSAVCTYLRDSNAVLFDCLRVHGSPATPEFHGMAFNLQRGEAIRRTWAEIPADADILVTHGPPLGHGDLTVRGERAGCADLLQHVEHRVRPAYHVFGHIHEACGVTTNGVTTFVNAATCNLRYFPENPPLVFEIGLSTV